MAVKCDGIDLAVVALEGMQASALGDAPNSSSGVVATGNNNIALNFKAADTSLMTHKDITAEARPDIPNSESCVSRARDCRVCIGHLETAHSGSVTAEGMETCAIGPRLA